MEIRISIEPRHVQGKGRALDAACEKAWEEIAGFCKDDVAISDWTFPVGERETITRAKSVYEKVMPDYALPLYEVILLSDISRRDRERADHLVFGLIGDSASGLDRYDSAELGDSSQSLTTCGVCGNTYQDPGFAFKISGKRLPKDGVFFSFNSEVSLFCRPEFVDSCLALGMTGISFQELDKRDTDGVDLFKVRVEEHRWNDSSGVCKACGMKTNVRHVQFFNLPERYQFDFQSVLVYSRHFFVLSNVAVDFLRGSSGLDVGHCRAPIWPNHLIDVIFPEDRLFMNGEYPTRVLVSLAPD